ncbi:MAG: DUF2628 domain-containing protein [Clostridia bacterium]|nr:DUF2628 domain-containing protein [Clostridia bacterium]
MYENKHCEYCGEQFAKNDDVVVCPDCGAPYHRKCWEEHGVCAHAAEHKTGYAYNKRTEDTVQPIEQTEDFIGAVKAQMAGAGQQAAQTDTADGAHCARCGAKFIGDDEYCVCCGHKKGDPVTKQTRKYARQDPLGGLAPQEEIDGYKAEDFALIVRSNGAKFMPLLKKLAQSKVKLSWSWPAFIFGYLYFFFRKLYKYGLIVILAQVLLLNVCNYALGDPVAQLSKIVNTQANTSITSDNMTQEEYYKVIEASVQEAQDSGLGQKFSLMLVLSMLPVHILCGMLFYALYLKHCKDTIARMQNSADILGGMTRSDFRLNLLTRGGVSLIGIVIGYFAHSAIVQIVAYIMAMFSS